MEDPTKPKIETNPVPPVDEDAIENSPAVQELLKRSGAAMDRIQGIISDIDALSEERKQMTAAVREKMRIAAEAIQAAGIEMDAAEREAEDAIDKLDLQFAEDMAQMDKEEAQEDAKENEE